MVKPGLPDNEKKRIAELQKYEILDTPAEQEYDEIVQLASQICGVPISLVTMVDTHRQWFKAKIGLEVSEIIREHAFCAHAIHNDEPFIVENATEDQRFKDNPLVTHDPNIQFYAGLPLVTPSGYKLGTLCVIDTVPRKLTDKQVFAIKVLTNQVVQQLELRYKNKKLAQMLKTIQQQSLEIEQNSQISTKLISIISHELSSPLSTLRGIISLLKESKLSRKEVDRIIDDVSSLIDGSLNLLQNLLIWKKTRIKKDKLELRLIDINDLLCREMEVDEVSIRTKGNTFLSLAKENEQVVADPTILWFILRNLIQNANHFTDDGIIELSVKEANGFSNITVKDSGRGIEKTKITQLFNWDSRSSTIGTLGERGAGLGLPICHEFAETMGGDILVKSEVGEGSTFTLRLPLPGTSVEQQ